MATNNCIFLAHASEDKPRVRELYDQLTSKGFSPWMDKVDVMPGQLWGVEIPRAIKSASTFLACLSKASVAKRGYVQREYRLALSAFTERPAGSVYLIPCRLDDCEVPDLDIPELGVKLTDFQWVDLFEADGFDRLVNALLYARDQAIAVPIRPEAAHVSSSRRGFDEIEQDLNTAVDRWTCIEPNSFEATEFYFDAVLPLVVEKAMLKEEHQELRQAGCDLLVSTCGFSPETTAIAASVIKPKKLTVIWSENTSSFNKLLHRYLLNNDVIESMRLDFKVVDPTNIDEISRTILAAIITSGGESRTIVDVTGGKKIMSASAAVAAWINHAQICYIDGEYSSKMRRPNPGSERVLVLDHPAVSRAGLLRKNALKTYQAGRMGIAAEQFRNSRDHNDYNQSFDELGFELSSIQVALSDVNVRALEGHVKNVRQLAERPALQHRLKKAKLAKALDLHLQSAQRILEGGDVSQLALFRYLSGLHSQHGRHDLACLMAHRELEKIIAVALGDRAQTRTFSLTEPNYDLFGVPRESLERRYASLISRLLSTDDACLPEQLSLVNGFILLCVVSRPGEVGYDADTIIAWAHELCRDAQARNVSILAHGFTNVDADDVERLRKHADRLLDTYLQDRALMLREQALTLDPPQIWPLSENTEL